MHLARLGLAVACASLGYLARAGLEPGAEAAPVEVAARPAAIPSCPRNNPPAEAEVIEDDRALAAAAAEVDPSDDEDSVPEDAGEDLGEVLAHAAAAQPTYPNRMHGVVTDGETNQLAGVTVIATSPAADHSRTAISDEHGAWTLTDLPPGNYTLTYYYADITAEQPGVGIGSVTEIEMTEQLVEPIRVERTYIKEIPVPGRTFEEAMGSAAGSQGDTYGVSFSGNETLENAYYIDGVDTSGLTFGNTEVKTE